MRAFQARPGAKHSTDQLAERDAKILQLRDEQGLPQKLIAERFGISRSMVGSICHRMRAKAKEKATL